MANYYLEKSDLYVENKPDIKEFNGDNSVIFNVKGFAFMNNSISDSYKDSIRKIVETEKLSKKERKALFSSMLKLNHDCFYEFPLNDTILTFWQSKVENERIVKENTSVEQKSVLTFYDFNNSTYNSEDLYDYRNYSQGYNTTIYSLSYLERMKEQQKIVNTSASAFELPVVNGDKTLKLEDYKGKWVLLDFWFISCKPCMELMPKIEELHKKYKSKGLEVLGINVDKNDERLQNFIKEKKIPYPTLSSVDKEVSKLYKVFGYPTLVLINPQQEIVIISNKFIEIEEYLKKNLK
jgi:peroxiredoxin